MNAKYQNMKLELYVTGAHNVHIPNHITKGIDMNIVKNMEFVFIAALALAGFTTFATADVTPAPKAAAVAAPVAADERIATVVVSTKRLTADQKARLGS